MKNVTVFGTGIVLGSVLGSTLVIFYTQSVWDFLQYYPVSHMMTQRFTNCVHHLGIWTTLIT